MSYSVGRQPFYVRESFAESFSNYDVIDPRIDVSAQKAPVREGEAFIIGGGDSRVPVRHTGESPYRFICKLECYFFDPLTQESYLSPGTGTLIGPRHVLTAAHMLFQGSWSGNRIYPVTPFMAFATPGQHGGQRPFGSSIVYANGFHFNPRFIESPSLDFGLIRLVQPLGKNEWRPARRAPPLGFWSSPASGSGTLIAPLPVNQLMHREVFSSGYPTDKCGDRPSQGSASRQQIARCPPGVMGTRQWRAAGSVVQPAVQNFPELTTYSVDVGEGQSGSPVWTADARGLNLYAIHTGGFPFEGAPVSANRGVRITGDVVRQLREWMRADGETPTF